MKLNRIIVVVFVVNAAMGHAQKAQRTPQDANRSVATTRAKSIYVENRLSSDETRWMREVYRQIDMEKEEKNRPLYYPTEPIDGQRNLFGTIFNLVCSEKLAAYEYPDGREIMNDSTRIKIKDILDKFHIRYRETGSGRIVTYHVEDIDIPCAEVKCFYIKERYLFDHRSSEYRTEIEAICPVLFREGEFGGEVVRYPMFWIKYDSLKPHLMNTRVMSSNINNSTTHSMADYLSLRLYKGAIFKTTNLSNQTLMQYCATPDSLEREQERIELQLSSFEENLWIDTLNASHQNKTIKNKNSSSSSKEIKSSTAKQNKVKTKTEKPQSVTKPGESSIRTVRRK